MRPKQHTTTGSDDLFRATLEQIINMKHELVQLAGKLDWAMNSCAVRLMKATTAQHYVSDPINWLRYNFARHRAGNRVR
jgi:hypothetical protein